MSYREVFEQIYSDGEWNDNRDDLPFSGPGSLPANATQMAAWIERWKPMSILDIGCGDMSWMCAVPTIEYVGVDVVPMVVEQNRVAYPHRDFRVLDAVEQPLPHPRSTRRWSLIVLRDILFHLDLDDAAELLHKARVSGNTVAVTHHHGAPNLPPEGRAHYAARDILSGPFRVNHSDVMDRIREADGREVLFVRGFGGSDR